MSLLDAFNEPCTRRDTSDYGVDMPIMDEPTLAETDPRTVGGRYRSGYWGQEYTVTATDVRHGVLWLTCRWADGDVTTHCTAWEPWRDTIISQTAAWSSSAPAGTGGRACER